MNILEQFDSPNGLNAVEHLRDNDSRLAGLIDFVIEKESQPLIRNRVSDYESLVGSIVSQQLSNAASTTILERLRGLMPQSDITPKAVVSLPLELIRQCGLSLAKANYIQAIGISIINGQLNLESLHCLPDEEVALNLQKVRGIGKWTSDMFLIFQLDRLDVFPETDAGIKGAVSRLYYLQNVMADNQLKTIAENWRPFRSIACRFLWKGLDRGYFKIQTFP